MLKDGLCKNPPVGRLKRRADFLRVAAARRKWAAPGLVLQVCPKPETLDTGADGVDSATHPSIRVGFTASRKVGNAVKRNRARRRLKAIAGEIVPALAQSGYDLVLIARPATVERPFDDLRRDLIQSLKRTKISAPESSAGANSSRESR